MSWTFRNIDPAATKLKIESKMNGKPSVDRTRGGKSHQFIKIDMPINELFYFTENVRTLDITEEFIKNESKPDDYFSYQNLFSSAVQNDYHKIIFKEAQKKEETYRKKFGDGQDIKGEENQTEAIIISSEGIIFNGNTRTSYWREIDYSVVECEVILNITDPQDIWPIVNAIDPNQDIKQDIRWYNRIKQLRKNSPNDNASDLAKKASLSLNVYKKYDGMYTLAEDFISRNYPGRDSFKNLSPGFGEAEQAFDSFYKGMKKIEEKSTSFQEKIKLIVHGLMISEEFEGQVYKHIDKIFHQANLSEELKNNNSEEENTSILDNDIIENNKTFEEITNEASDALDEAERRKMLHDSSNQKQAFSKSIQKSAKQIRSARAYLSQDYDKSSANEALTDLEAAIEEIKGILGS